MAPPARAHSGLRGLTRRSAVLLLASTALLGCGESDSPPDPTPDPASNPGRLALVPGSDLLHTPERLEVRAMPASCLPAELVPPVRALLERPVAELAADDWHAGAVEQTWLARPALRLDLAVGPPWVAVDGRLCRATSQGPGRDQDADTASLFVDDVGGALLSWDADSGQLRLRAEELPEQVSVGYDLREDAWLSRAEGRLAGPAPVDARGLACRVDLDRDSRPALCAPAGTELAVELGELSVDALAVALGVAPLGFATDSEGRLALGEQTGDGVTFAVDVEQAGARRRLWSRHVTAAEGWVDDVVDLSSLAGVDSGSVSRADDGTDDTADDRADDIADDIADELASDADGDAASAGLRLLLVTEPGPGGDADFDHGVWGRLRAQGAPRQPPARPHVVIVDIDTLRADRLGCYGHARDTSPRLDAWAASQAMLFEDASAPGTWTLPSTVSMLTGLTVAQHGVSVFPQALAAVHQPLARRLADVGYETWARTDGGYVSAAFGFAEGFDRYDYRRRPWADHERDGWDDLLAELSARRSERPVFLFLQTYQVHMPLREDRRFDDPAQPYDGPLVGRRIQTAPLERAVAAGELQLGPRELQYIDDLYDAGVRRMDDVVGRFLEGLDAALGGEPCLVVFSSDHGEELHDHGGMGHGARMHREVVAVPLIVRAPHGDLVGRSGRPSSGLDIAPTVLDAVGLPIPDELPGVSLLRTPPERRLVVAEYAPRAFAARFDGWTLLRTDAEALSLFRQADDPYELDDLLERQAERADELRGMVEAWQAEREPVGADADGQGAVGGALVDELRALGYLGGEDG